MGTMIVLSLLSFSTLLALKKPRIALFLAIFFIPWAGLDVDIGLRVTAYLIMAAPLFVMCTLRTLVRPGTTNLAEQGLLWFVISYAIVWTIAQILFLPELTVEGGGLRQPVARSVMQIIMFLITLSPVWIVPLLMRQRADLISIGRIYILSVVLLASIGWLQLMVWMATGTDPLPVGFCNQLLGGQGAQRSGVFGYLGERIHRMSSLGGEPKDLGIGIAVALLLLQSAVKENGRYTLWLWPFLFISMIATFSTSAILGWLGATVLQLFVTPNCTIGIPPIRQWFRGLLRWSVWLIPLLFVVFLSGKSGDLFDMIEMRTTGRIAESEHGLLEDFNVAVFDFLVDQPLWSITGTGLGNAHLYATPYLPDYAIVYAGGTSFVAKSNALRWVSEVGVVITLVFLHWVITRIFAAVRRGYQHKNYSAVAAVLGKFALPLVALWLSVSYVTAQFYTAIGFCISLAALAQAESNHKFPARKNFRFLSSPTKKK